MPEHTTRRRALLVALVLVALAGYLGGGYAYAALADGEESSVSVTAGTSFDDSPSGDLRAAPVGRPAAAPAAPGSPGRAATGPATTDGGTPVR